MISIRLLTKLFGYFVLFLTVAAVLIFYIISKPIQIESISYLKKKKIDDRSIDFIGQRALFLAPFKLDVSIPEIKDEIEVFKLDSRPDEIKQKKFVIKFKKNLNERKILENENLYIRILDEKSFDFSDTQTPLILSLNQINEDEVQIQIKADLKEIGLAKSHFNTFIVKPLDYFIEPTTKDENFQKLLSTKWWGQDLFLKIYKNEKSDRLEIDSSIFHLHLADILICKDGVWQKSEDQDSQNYLIAKIKTKDKKNMQIEAWNLRGDKYLFTIPKETKQYIPRADQFITSARYRTKTYIRCQIEKQMLIVKQNDIVLKKDGRWKVLKKNIDINEIKNNELFYFQKIESKNDTSYLIGYLFSPMRTSYQKIEVAISSISNHKRIKKRVIR